MGGLKPVIPSIALHLSWSQQQLWKNDCMVLKIQRAACRGEKGGKEREGGRGRGRERGKEERGEGRNRKRKEEGERRDGGGEGEGGR